MEVDFVSEEEEEMSGANLSRPDVLESGKGKEEASGVGSFSLVQLPLPILLESGKGKETNAETDGNSDRDQRRGIRTCIKDVRPDVY